MGTVLFFRGGPAKLRTVPFFVAAAAAVVVLQAACGEWLEVRGARPDLVLAFVVGVGLLAGWRTGSITGAAAGWCALALTPGHPWYWLLLYAGVGGLTGLVGHPFSRENSWWRALLVLAAAVAPCLVLPLQRAWMPWGSP